MIDGLLLGTFGRDAQLWFAAELLAAQERLAVGRGEIENYSAPPWVPVH